MTMLFATDATTMSDAGMIAIVTAVVTGVVTITTMLVGFFTLWVKLKYGVKQAEEAATKAATAASNASSKADSVEKKLDANTVTTEAVDLKTDTIVKQTNGVMENLRLILNHVTERVTKLEEYNRESAHRLLGVINGLALKIERLLAVQELKPPAPPGG